MLYLIGVGLKKDYRNNISLYGLSVIKECTKIYLLTSSYHPFFQDELEKDVSSKCIPIKPNSVIEILGSIKNMSEHTAFLMPGNPFCDDLFSKIVSFCYEWHIDYKVIHNTCYLNAFGNAGIQLYKIGQKFFLDDLKNEEIKKCLSSLYSCLQKGLNSLILLNQLFLESLSENILKEIVEVKPNEYEGLLGAGTKIVALHRLSSGSDFLFEYGTAQSILDTCESFKIEALCVCASFDCIEEEYLRETRVNQSKIDLLDKKGTFNVIGLGLGKPEDITGRGYELIQNSHKVFLEGYTSIMLNGKESLENFYEKDLVIADRELVEQNSDEILKFLDDSQNVSFLVVGDPLGATTHTDIILRSLKKTKNMEIVNNTSIINAFGLCGLKPGRFGGIVSIPFWSDTYKPDSFCDKISSNLENGWHTLCLLDIQVKEQSFENLARGRKIYEKPRYMTPSVAAEQLLDSVRKRLEEGRECYLRPDSPTISLSRIGTDLEKIISLPLSELVNYDFGAPLHSLVIVGVPDKEEEHYMQMQQR